MYNHHRN